MELVRIIAHALLSCVRAVCLVALGVLELTVDLIDKARERVLPD